MEVLMDMKIVYMEMVNMEMVNMERLDMEVQGIVHARKHQPAWHSKHLWSTFSSRSELGRHSFTGHPLDSNDDSAPL